jgi:hypothetical protein
MGFDADKVSFDAVGCAAEGFRKHSFDPKKFI